MFIETEPVPALPAAQAFPGAYLPGIVPGAAAGQYGAPMLMPGGPVIVFGSGHYDPAAAIRMDQGGPTPGSVPVTGKASGD